MLRVSFTYIYYTLDPIGFIEKLCENKDQPELQCNGKCHLKKVTESSKSSEETPLQIIDFKDILLHQNTSLVIDFKIKPNTKKAVFGYQNYYKYLIGNSSFHPPQV
ncbi:hypothetical protein [Polaribacter sp.]|uniref:hypothetical protein n=1 Tax=Polaribacter sp. TaxID=1920175 RepID=UPI003F6A5D64